MGFSFCIFDCDRWNLCKIFNDNDNIKTGQPMDIDINWNWCEGMLSLFKSL